MPDCFFNKGGRLRKSNPLFQETYSTVLMIQAVGSLKGGVNFNRVGKEGAWSECEITGFDLRP